MTKRIIFALIFIFYFSPLLFSKGDTDSIEVFVIDSFFKRENNSFVLSFYTSSLCKSVLILDNKNNYPVSEDLTDNHSIEVDLTKYNSNRSYIEYYLLLTDENNYQHKSEVFELEFRSELVVSSSQSSLYSCLFGAVVFLIPSPSYINAHSIEFFRLKKEISLFTWYSGGFNHPAGALNIGYAYTFQDFAPRNILLLNYKHIIEIPAVEYISPSIGGFTNFKGNSGASTGLSLGLFNIYNVFTLELSGHYFFNPLKKGTEYWDISIGLFSSFFSLHF